MANLSWAWLLLISVSQVVQSAEPARKRWNKPDGNDDNFVETWYIGDTVKLSWSGWDKDQRDRTIEGLDEAKLYVNAWNPDYSTWSKVITANASIDRGSSFTWTIDIPDSTLSKTKEYAVTFIPMNQTDHKYTGSRLSSPGFRIQSKSTTTSSASVTAFATTSKTASSLSEPSPSHTNGLSTGAKAGIGVGVSIAGLAVLIALGFLFVRRRHQASSQDIDSAKATGDGYNHEAKPVTYELFTTPAELPGTPGRR
ncbi:hypothetical protein N7537_000535 [Penicillium hordei]|uniref:Mid2 domain-containing protein n=1 Tax=Penicillium hordei TaxID=40994 RepID=A0AAD6H557_9EURO|nr:uncharacterized protein N7537_000535 [Penicillium hordei]KAJ5615421.1 hypothetical protein N7537_000535 [Penicillium hordei]